MARVEAGGIIRVNKLKIDLLRYQVAVGGHPLHLTPKEFRLLAFLAQNKGRTFTRDQIMEKVWGYDYEGNTKTVDVHIRWLRKKIEADPGHPRYIVTVRGIGYRFD